VAAFSSSSGQKLWEQQGTAKNNAFGMSLAASAANGGSIIVGEPGFDAIQITTNANGKQQRKQQRDVGRIVTLSQRDGSKVHSTVGDAANGWLGFSVTNAGDVNHDGFEEYAGGAPHATGYRVTPGARRNGQRQASRQVSLPKAGKVILASGANGAVLAQVSGTTTTSLFGYSLIGVQDEHGFPNLGIGAPGGAGQLFVYAINDTGQLVLLSSHAGEKAGERLGYAITSGEAGTGSKQHIIGGAPFNGDGAVYVLSGSATLGQ
jgi:Cu/Zn superoxide dismutase